MPARPAPTTRTSWLNIAHQPFRANRSFFGGWQARAFGGHA
jgi:hypothetical protein